MGERVFCARGPEECDGIAEPEEDGEARYYKCTKPECGFEFGYQIVEAAEPDSCQLGVSEDVRLAHSAVPVQSGVFLGSTIKRRAE